MCRVDYRRWWDSRRSISQFGEQLSAAWAAEYLAATGAREDDLVSVDPGNGFTYTFDLAGVLRGQPCAWEPRVVGVWGRSDPGRPSRDLTRMRGHPRPVRTDDDRGHLIAYVAGGGYDINLVPMDAALNRGWSREGARFRELERLAAAVSGSVFFVRLVYVDDTARPSCLEVGVQVGEDLRLDTFLNTSSGTRPMRLAALHRAAAFPITDDVISGCLDPAAPRDQLFSKGWKSGPMSLTREERCAVAGVTGHIAESVAELVLDALEWRVLWHFTGPGRHGVDLVVLATEGTVLAIEVKGTLVPGWIPRLSRRELAQMSAAWIDKADNPGMAELGLGSDDVYGGVVIINFADRTWRAALTADFATLLPVCDIEQLTDLGWLDDAVR